MAVYRYQCTCVGMWRGKIKRWNTTFHYSTSANTAAIHDRLQRVCYPNPGDVTGDCSGGLASIAVYASTGGAPVVQTTYFDWQQPSAWIPYLGTDWSGVPEGTPIDASGESAMLIVGNMGSLSRTGKPVTTRKYIHAVPSRTAADFTDPDIDSTSLAAIEAEFSGGFGLPWMANPAGVQPDSTTVEPYYGNHQRVRGRRRTTNQVAAQSFSAGVVAGTATGAAGAASPQ